MSIVPPTEPSNNGGATDQSKDSAATIAKDDLDFRTQRTRAWTGLWVVAAGDAVIAAAAVLAIVKLKTGGADTSQVVAILTAAFTAVSTMTTAYFGIRAVT